MVDFYPVITEDGTISLYNTVVNDIYHSKIGAYTEALNKFIIPSGILDFVRTNNSVSILDVCYGLGYNSRVAVSEIWKVNPACKINVTAIDLDPNVLAYSCFVGFDNENSISKDAFILSMLLNTNVYSIVRNYYADVNNNNLLASNISPFLEDVLNNLHVCLQDPEISTSLHNIYYRSISDRYKKSQNLTQNVDRLNIAIYIDDVRKVITALEPEYNYIFHDPFAPSKLPTLWTVELFKELSRLLSNNGNITTYSSSPAIRGGLLEAGFYIGVTIPVGRKSSGTIAVKNPDLITNKLSGNELKILETTAGIPYHDINLNADSSQIINQRKKMQILSGRISASSFRNAI